MKWVKLASEDPLSLLDIDGGILNSLIGLLDPRPQMTGFQCQFLLHPADGNLTCKKHIRIEVNRKFIPGSHRRDAGKVFWPAVHCSRDLVSGNQIQPTQPGMPGEIGSGSELRPQPSSGHLKRCPQLHLIPGEGLVTAAKDGSEATSDPANRFQFRKQEGGPNHRGVPRQRNAEGIHDLSPRSRRITDGAVNTGGTKGMIAPLHALQLNQSPADPDRHQDQQQGHCQDPRTLHPSTLQTTLVPISTNKHTSERVSGTPEQGGHQIQYR